MALPSKAPDKWDLVDVDRFDGANTDGAVTAAAPAMSFEDDEAPVPVKGLPESLRPNNRLGRAAGGTPRPSAGDSRPSGAGARGSSSGVFDVDVDDACSAPTPR